MPEEKPQQSNTPNFNDLEKDILKFWDENKIFQKSLEQTKDGEPYIFYDGPPFATGLPHYGSILPSVIKDAIPRYQTMKGKYVRRRWGWDCHGLPIENIVEQALKISGKKQIEELGVEKFNQACRENVLRYAHEWGKTISRIGRWVEFGPPSQYSSSLVKDSGGPSAVALAKADDNASVDVGLLNNKVDLHNAYMTMQTSYMESVWWALKQIWEKGLIYEDRKVLLYCSRCETPISNFEVAMDNSYRDITEESVYAKFKMLKGQRIINDLTNDKTYALAWTTTPWTLPGNTALNIGPDIIYVMVEMEDNHERYILAKERLSIIEGQYEIIAEFPARALESLQYEPLYPGVINDPKGRAHRIYLADFVTTTDGTGIVHNAAMYGEEDYQLAKEKDLPRVDMLDNKGHYLPLEGMPENLRGVFFKNADKIILPELEAKGLVYKTQSYTHSYPHCYRCGTPLYYNALPAWFINIQKIKTELLQNNESVNWYPEHLKHGRFKLGIENAPDWNISRNRYWATALPFWKCGNKECRNVICVGSVDELKERSLNFEQVYPGVGAELARPSSEEGGSSFAEASADRQGQPLQDIDLHRPYIDHIKLKCDACGGEMSRVPEVVDCWVESGSMPFAELHAPFENQELFGERFPADFVVEYIPQTRAWFYVMHVINTILFAQAPFKNVVTTGTILAEDGSKMSKSKNNYPDPALVIEKYGADALRFYLLTSVVVTGEDLNFSEKGVAETSRKMNMLLYNVWSFYRMYEKDKLKVESQKLKVEHILDKWIIAKLNKTGIAVGKFLDEYDTVRAGKEILDFVNELSTWYVRRNRDRIKANDESAKEALQVLGFVLSETAKLLAPFMPFLAEFIYKDVTGAESVHLTGWTEFIAADETVLADMSALRVLVESGLALRKENNMKVRQPLAEIEYHIKNNKVLAPELEAVLAEELNVKQVSGRGDFAPKNGYAHKDTPEFKLALNLELSDELRREGTARELERQVQDLRKKSGLKVGELVDLYYNTQDDALEEILLKLVDRKKTFVSQISRSLEIEVDFETQGEVDSKPIWLGMIKI